MVSDRKRYAFIDALRGFAALIVVVYHSYDKNMLHLLTEPLPQPLHWIGTHGYLGVYIFFVLSGFVITYSVTGFNISAGFVGRFALRRSIRLDLPYWTTILLVLLNLFLSNHFLGRGIEYPSTAQVISNFIYLQNILGYGDVLGVFWTLCMEIQFYLCFVVILACVQKAHAKLGTRVSFENLRNIVFGVFFVLAWLCLTQVVSINKGLFLSYWPYFFLGSSACWVFQGSLKLHWFVLLSIAVLGGVFIGAPDTWALIFGVATAACILLVRHNDYITTLGFGPVVQLLGKVSYSLYLIHMLVSSRIARMLSGYFGPDMSHATKLLIICVSASGAVFVAYLFYRVVEKPSMQLARRVSLRA